MSYFDAYFVVPPERYKNGKLLLVPDGDVMPLADNINAFPLYLDDEKVIVRMRVEGENLRMWIDHAKDFGCDPFSKAGVAAMGLGSSYVGVSWDEVAAAFPELVEDKEATDPVTGEKYTYQLMKDTVILGGV